MCAAVSRPYPRRVVMMTPLMAHVKAPADERDDEDDRARSQHPAGPHRSEHYPDRGQGEHQRPDRGRHVRFGVRGAWSGTGRLRGHRPPGPLDRADEVSTDEEGTAGHDEHLDGPLVLAPEQPVNDAHHDEERAEAHEDPREQIHPRPPPVLGWLPGCGLITPPPGT